MELLLKNGLIYDGTVNKPKIQDIYIKNNIINQIGNNLNMENVKTIDCTNLIVAPGFIDAHSHNDFFVNKDNIENTIGPFLKQGITTQIVGNCGFSTYGVSNDSPNKHFIGGNLFKANEPGSLNDFSKQIEGNLLLNIVPLIGHSTTRTSIAGYSSNELTKEELDKQLHLVEEALIQGAFGGSLGLMYVPGMFALKDELIEFAKMIKKYDGILTVHARASSKIALGYPLFSKPHMEIALDEIIEIMEITKVRMEYSHLIFVGKASWKCVKPMLNKFKEIINKGFDIGYDIYPFTYGASVITVVLPSWYLKLSPEKRKNPFNLLKLKLIINITKKLLGIEFSDMVISYISEDYRHYEGKNVEEIAKIENIKPFEMYLKLVELSQGKGRIMFGKYYNEEIILKLMRDDLSIFMTDAWYEETGTQNAGTYQAFPYFLQKTKENHLDLEKTINKMTKETAERFKISKRGMIKEGYFADITIFNYNEIEVDLMNPNKTPKGIKHVIVNGELIVEDYQLNKNKPGILLRKENQNKS